MPQWFVGVPTKYGWYLYHSNPRAWNQASPVAVEERTTPTRKSFWMSGAITNYEFVEIVGGSNRDGIWYGPLDIPDPPPSLIE